MKVIHELSNIRLRGRKTNRLTNINLKIYSGEKIALLGKSGSGKSSLISIANGALYPDEGHVLFKGENIHRINQKKRQKIATIWQELLLIDELSSIQNVNCGALGKNNLIWAIRNLTGTLNPHFSSLCLLAAGLPAVYHNANIKLLSGGQRQRIAIARMLRQEAELLLADEPFSNLDPTLVKQTLNLLQSRTLNEKVSPPKTILVSLHRPDLIKSFDRIIGLREGKIIINKSVNEINELDINYLYS